MHQQARDADAAAQRRHNGFERSATGRRGSGAADACQGVDWAGSRVCKDSGEQMAGGLPSQDRFFFGRPDFDFLTLVCEWKEKKKELANLSS